MSRVSGQIRDGTKVLVRLGAAERQRHVKAPGHVKEPGDGDATT